jgi:succinate dehydrogenase / fumarate reductase, cytochrome b subunit
VRHLAWDVGYGFEKPTYNRSGWTVVIATVVVTLLVWIVGFAVW